MRGVTTRLLAAATVAALLLGLVPAASPLALATGSFVTRDGQRLMLDGHEFRFSGINMYNANSDGWCGPDYTDQQLADAFDEISGGDDVVVRAWFFQSLAAAKTPGGSHLWSGARDWSRMDRLLSIAAAHHVHIIATLTDNWGECGGGTNYAKTADFYASGYTTPDPTEAAQYDNWVSYYDWTTEIVSRYANNDTILFWQLINEAEVNPNAPGGCPPGTGPGDTLKAWAQDVSDHVRSLDSNHLISLGTIGSGQCGTGSTAEYQRVHDLPNIDLCEVHDYDDQSLMPGDLYNGMQTRIDACRALDKPLFVGEFGLIPSDFGWTTLQERADNYRARILRQEAEGIVGHLAWAYVAAGSALDNYDIGPGDPALTVLREAPDWVVNSTDDTDDGVCDATHCSLREAIAATNGNAGLDTIGFRFGALAQPAVISLASQLPDLTSPVVIDGTTEDQFGIVQIDGSAIAPPANGLVVAAGDSRLEGLSIGGFSAFAKAGIVLGGTGRSSIVGDLIGLDATMGSVTPNRLGVLVLSPLNVIGTPGDGNVIAGNTDHGIKVGMAEQPSLDTHGNVIQANVIGYNPGPAGEQIISAPNVFDGIELNTTTGTLVGGTGPGQGNVISGNGRIGVDIESPANVVQGNLIGTDASGTVAVPNTAGIVVWHAANNLIGGSNPGAGNVMSGNTYYAIQVDGAPTDPTYIEGNLIGTDASGMAALGNGIYGVLLTGNGTRLGGTSAGSGNVISGNGDAGVVLGATALGNQILGNLIGVGSDGVTPLPNCFGVYATDSSQNNSIGAEDLAGPNTIANNTYAGIVVAGSAESLSVWANRIHSNGGLGIDILNDGPTPNDPDDADSGPNHLANTPLVTDAVTSGSTTIIRGSVDGAPGTAQIVVDFYDNTSCDPSGFGEGAVPIGETVLAPDVGGDVTFEFDPASGQPGLYLPVGDFVTATATHSDTAAGWDTSEFSGCVEVTGGSGESVAGDVAAHGVLTTDTEGDGATPSDPVETWVSPGRAGHVSIEETPSSVPPPVGYSIIGSDVAINAPASTAANPIVITVQLDASVPLPTGIDETNLQLLRNGVALPDCTGPAGRASPNPCVSSRTRLADGDIQLVALTSQASLWQLAVVGPYAFTGFLPPVANPPRVNVVRAGRVVPVRFTLGGKFGLNVLATGSPTVTLTSCTNPAHSPTTVVPAQGLLGLIYVRLTGRYIYLWKTSRAWAGSCGQLTLRFDDGSTRSADFKFTR